MSDIVYQEVDQVLADINAATPSTAEELEAFRIKYLGSKNTIKPLFAKMKDIPNEGKKPLDKSSMSSSKQQKRSTMT